MTKSLVLLVAALDAITGVSAFFRMECRGRLAMARIDPLVNNNEVGQHVHAIHGSNGKSNLSNFCSCLANTDLCCVY